MQLEKLYKSIDIKFVYNYSTIQTHIASTFCWATRDIQLSTFRLDFHRQTREKKLSHHIVGWVERIPPKAAKSEKTETVSKTGIFTRDRVKPNAFRLS